MARSREFKMVMRGIYWFCILAIVLFIGYIGWEIFTTVDKGMKN